MSGYWRKDGESVSSGSALIRECQCKDVRYGIAESSPMSQSESEGCMSETSYGREISFPGSSGRAEMSIKD